LKNSQPINQLPTERRKFFIPTWQWALRLRLYEI